MAAAVFGENAMRIVMASQAGGAGVAAEQPQGRRGGILADGAMTPPAVITASPMEGRALPRRKERNFSGASELS
jgi:hypothetical protein